MLVNLPLGMRRRRGSIPEGNAPAQEPRCMPPRCTVRSDSYSEPSAPPPFSKVTKSRTLSARGFSFTGIFLQLFPTRCPMLRYWVLIVKANQRTVDASQLVKLHDDTASFCMAKSRQKFSSTVVHLPPCLPNRLHSRTCGVTTLNVFLSGALTVALPTIGKELGFKQADLQWPLNVFALSYGCLLLFFGRVGDIVGARTLFLVGSAWFSVWSIATAFAPNAATFILFVALKGMGAAANTPAGIGILSTYFPPGPKRSKAFGAVGAGQPLGFIGGLVVGGVLTDSHATWRAIFYIQAALGGLFVTLGWLVLPQALEAQRYKKGLDWGGAIISTIAVGLMTYSLADSGAATRRWATPHIPALLATSVILLGLLLCYEKWREQRNLSVLIPLSIWRQPNAKMGSMVAVAFLAWWSFNTLAYFATLYYQQVKFVDPAHTSIRFIPMVTSGFIVNVVTGFLVSRLPGQGLILAGLSATMVATIIFSTINVNASYWASAFLVMIFVVGVDAVYPVGNLHLVRSFDDASQSLAGGIFAVATRLGTSIGLALTSTIATAASARYNAAHPDLPADSPEVLMVGFRAAGWTCFAAAGVAFCIAAFGLRNIGVVGKTTHPEDEDVLVRTPTPEGGKP